MTIGPSAAHAGIALACIGVGAGLWMLGLRGPHWQGAMLAIGWAWSRELAQFLRGKGKGRPLSEFGMDQVRQAGWPSLLALAFAIGVKALT